MAVRSAVHAEARVSQAGQEFLQSRWAFPAFLCPGLDLGRSVLSQGEYGRLLQNRGVIYVYAPGAVLAPRFSFTQERAQRTAVGGVYARHGVDILYRRSYADEVVSVAERLQRLTDLTVRLHCPKSFISHQHRGIGCGLEKKHPIGITSGTGIGQVLQ